MKKILFIVFFTSSVLAQQVNYKVNGNSTNIYNDAVLHFTKLVYNNNNVKIDTLFVLKNEEFTENSLLNKINNLPIFFIDTTDVSGRVKNNQSITALNMVADENMGKERINIIILSFLVTKKNEKIIYKPLKSCRARYFYSSIKKEFEFRNIACDY